MGFANRKWNDLKLTDGYNELATHFGMWIWFGDVWNAVKVASAQQHSTIVWIDLVSEQSRCLLSKLLSWIWRRCIGFPNIVLKNTFKKTEGMSRFKQHMWWFDVKKTASSFFAKLRCCHYRCHRCQIDAAWLAREILDPSDQSMDWNQNLGFFSSFLREF